MSLLMENVVVEVEVTLHVGLSGSGMRFDCVSFRLPRLRMASSERNVCSNLTKRTRWGSRGRRLTMRAEKRSLRSCLVLAAVIVYFYVSTHPGMRLIIIRCAQQTG